MENYIKTIKLLSTKSFTLSEAIGLCLSLLRFWLKQDCSSFSKVTSSGLQKSYSSQSSEAVNAYKHKLVKNRINMRHVESKFAREKMKSLEQVSITECYDS